MTQNPETPKIPDKYKLMDNAEHTVVDDDNDIRVDRWFKRHYPGFPHAPLEKNLRKGLGAYRRQESQVVRTAYWPGR